MCFFIVIDAPEKQKQGAAYSVHAPCVAISSSGILSATFAI